MNLIRTIMALLGLILSLNLSRYSGQPSSIATHDTSPKTDITETYLETIPPEKVAAVIPPDDAVLPDWEVNPNDYRWPSAVEWNESESRWIYTYDDGNSYEPVHPTEPTQESAISTYPVNESIPNAEPALVPTEPESTVHTHSWQTIEYPEIGHYETYYSCACGYPLQEPSAYDNHVAAYAGTVEMFTVHGHWGSAERWVVDSYRSIMWQCLTCNDIINHQP